MLPARLLYSAKPLEMAKPTKTEAVKRELVDPCRSNAICSESHVLRDETRFDRSPVLIEEAGGRNGYILFDPRVCFSACCDTVVPNAQRVVLDSLDHGKVRLVPRPRRQLRYGGTLRPTQARSLGRNGIRRLF